MSICIIPTAQFPITATHNQERDIVREILYGLTPLAARISFRIIGDFFATRNNENNRPILVYDVIAIKKWLSDVPFLRCQRCV